MSLDDDIDALLADPWPTPQPLPVAPPAPEFPRGVLPHWIQARCDNLAAHMRVPVELPITVALGVLSTLTTHGRATITVTDGWTDPVSLYLWCAMPPGSGKSPVFAALKAPLTDLADQWRAQHEDAARHALAHRKIAEKAVKEAEFSGDPTELVAALEALDEARTPAEPDPILDDTNTESFERALEANGGTVAVLSDEAGILDTVARLVESGKSPNLQSLLQAWGGGDVKVSRLSRSASIRSARATMLLTPQPTVVDKLIKAHPDYAGRGLSDRYMPCIPPSLVGQRDYTDVEPLDRQVAHEWAERIAEIARTHPWGRTEDIEYRLSAEAYQAFNLWRNTIEARRGGPEAPLAPLAGIPEKVGSSVLRLAAILHIADGLPPSTEVDIHTYCRAESVGEWWLGHALAAYGEVSPEMAEAQELVEWLVERGERHFTTRDINESGRYRRSRPTVEEQLELVARLVDHDLVRPLRGDWRRPRRGVKNEFECHPDLRVMARHARQLDHDPRSVSLSVDEGDAHDAHDVEVGIFPPSSSSEDLSPDTPEAARHARHLKQPLHDDDPLAFLFADPTDPDPEAA